MQAIFILQTSTHVIRSLNFVVHFWKARKMCLFIICLVADLAKQILYGASSMIH